jgi:hypothetical protein
MQTAAHCRTLRGQKKPCGMISAGQARFGDEEELRASYWLISITEFVLSSLK